MAGQQVCFWHGGAARKAKAAAARRLAQAEAAREVSASLASTDAAPVTDPLSALARLAGEVESMKRVLAERVNRLDARPDPDRVHLSIELAAYERALDRSARLLDILARSGVEERHLRITEQQGLLFAGAQRAILQRMFDALLRVIIDRGLATRELEWAMDEAWQTAMGVVVPEELRAIAKREAVL